MIVTLEQAEALRMGFPVSDVFEGEYAAAFMEEGL